MPRKGHSEEEILQALRQAEAREKSADICRAHGVSPATLYIWKKRYAELGLSEMRKENDKLKRLVANLSLDRHILQEALRKKV